MSAANKLKKKIKPFKYPSKSHVRTEAPEAYTDYRKFKPTLAREFNNQCIYCRKPRLPTDDKASFHVEHYKPQSRFPELACEYSNLYYACAACNRSKGAKWPSGNVFIVNPCDFTMSQHLAFDIDTIAVSKSRCGAYSIEALQLNSKESLAARKYIGSLVEGLIKQLQNPPKKNSLSASELRQYAKMESDLLTSLSQLTCTRECTLRKALKLKLL